MRGEQNENGIFLNFNDICILLSEFNLQKLNKSYNLSYCFKFISIENK